MSKYKKITLLFCLMISCFLFFLSGVVNRAYFEVTANENVWLYEGRQVLELFLLVMIGYVFIKLIQTELSEIWVYLFALPMGIVIWTTVSFIILLVGIPYTMYAVFIGIGVILLSLFLVRIKSKRKIIRNKHGREFGIILICLCLLLSTGFIFVLLGYDCYYYFINYGNSLTIFQSFEKMVGNNSYTLTNVGQLLPLLNSYTAFWRLDQSYQVQGLLVVNMVMVFVYGLYGRLVVRYDSKKACMYTALFTAVLLTSTSFIIISAWALSNVYCMAFLVFVFFLGEISMSKKTIDIQILMSLSLLALTLLRKDGLIFAIFLLICIATKNTFSNKQMLYMIAPSIICQLVWLYYVRNVLAAKVSMAAATSITNDSNVYYVLAIVIATVVYLGLRVVFKKLLKWERLFIFIGLLCLTGLVFLKNPTDFIDNFDNTIKNIFILPSSWGISGYIFVAFITISLLRAKKFFDYYGLVWIGYAIITFLSYTMAKRFWFNWDDSFNRVLLQIVPIFIFAMAENIIEIITGNDKIAKAKIEQGE